MARILVIEDEALVRDTLCQYLEGAGHELLVAENGEQGLEIYRSHNPDLVISDVSMPTREGISTLVELRRLNPDAKIVMMSGGTPSGVTDYLELAQQLGAAAVLHKPFRKAHLVELVRKILGD
jgi:CheY-like chemotaxis protein